MTQADTPQGEMVAPVAFGSTITILFSDIRGFTEFTDAHGDEAAYRMLQHHNSLVQEQIELHGGHIVKTLGDSFMVSFDAARTAVTCAVGMQRAVEQYNRTQQGPKIEIGIGINTGEPVRDADDLFGGAVNLASRICAASGPGRVLVSETVRHVVERIQGSEWVDRGFFDIKGFTQPQHLFEVDWSSAGAVRATQVAPPSGVARPAPVAVAPLGPAKSLSRSWLLLAAWLLLAGGAAAFFLLAGVIGSTGFLSSSRATQPSTAEHEGSAAQTGLPGKLLRSDDFSDPAKGLFLDSQRGTSVYTRSDGAAYEYQWQYGYADGALVVRLKAPSPPIPAGNRVSLGAPAADRVLGDFAVEVRARATKSLTQASYSIDYVLAGADRYFFVVAPTPQRHGISLGPERRNFMSNDRNSAINRGGEENSLRMEVRGDTMTVFVNGVEVDRAQHEGLKRRGGSIELAGGMGAQPAEGEIEVQFMDFKVYSLGP